MADNLRKYTTQEVLNKVYTDSSGNAIGINSSTTKETLNAVFSTSDNSLNVALSGGTISGDVTIDGDLTVNGNGTGNYDEIVNGNLVLSSGSKLGIGSESPDATLHLQDGNNTEIRFTFGSDQYINKITNEWAGGSASDCKTRFFISDGSTTNANEVLTLTGDKRVGIGTNSPEADIAFEPDVYTTANQGIRWQDPVVTTDAIVQGVRQASNVGIGVFIGANCQVDTSGANTRFNTSDESSFISVDPRGDLYFGTGGTGANPSTRMHIDSSGNVGIGTSPTDTLHLSASVPIIRLTDSDTNDYHRIYGSNGGLYFDADKGVSGGTATSVIGFGIDDVRVMTLVSGGNVGISQDDPQSKLHINVGTDQNLEVTSVSDKIHLMGTNDARNANIPLTLGFTEYDFEGANGSTIRLKSTNSDITGAELVGKLEAYISDTSGDLPGVAGSIDWTTNGSIDGGSTKGTNFTLKTYVESAGLVTNMVLDSNSRISLSNNDSGTGGSDGTSGNTLMGYLAGDNISSSGHDNTFFGHSAGNGNTSGEFNTALGNISGLRNQTGSQNTYVGYASGLGVASNSHSNNTGVGYNALKAIRTGGDNVAVGKDALSSAAFGETGNVAIGHESMSSLNEGSIGTADNNIAIGKQALTGGAFAGNPTVVNDNIAIGAFALDATSDNAQTGTIAIGRDALGALTTGARNTAVGYQAMDELTTGEDNVAFGYGALGGASTSSENKRNVAIGNSAMSGTNAGASQNIAIGYAALDGALTATADNNTAVGYEALGAVTSGRGNVAIGSAAGDAITSGVENVIIGRDSDVSAVDSGNEIVLGYNVTGQGANKATIGNADITDVYMAQDSGALVHTAGIQFPASQVADGGANVLDDYEEGTWSVTDGSGAGLSFTLENNAYVKIGKLVTASAIVTFPSTSNSSSALLTLPFNASSVSSASGGAVLEQDINSTKSYTMAVDVANGVKIRENGSTTQTNANLSGKKIRFIITYHSA